MYATPNCGKATNTAAMRKAEPMVNEESRNPKLSSGAPARSPVISTQHFFRHFGGVTIQDRLPSVKEFQRRVSNFLN
jgi:hypothetical protein